MSVSVADTKGILTTRRKTALPGRPCVAARHPQPLRMLDLAYEWIRKSGCVSVERFSLQVLGQQSFLSHLTQDPSSFWNDEVCDDFQFLASS